MALGQVAQAAQNENIGQDISQQGGGLNFGNLFNAASAIGGLASGGGGLGGLLGGLFNNGGLIPEMAPKMTRRM